MSALSVLKLIVAQIFGIVYLLDKMISLFDYEITSIIPGVCSELLGVILTATSSFFSVELIWYIFFYLFTFNLYVFLYLKRVSYRQYCGLTSLGYHVFHDFKLLL